MRFLSTAVSTAALLALLAIPGLPALAYNHDKIECQRAKHGSGDFVTVRRQENGTKLVELGGNGGWLRNLEKVLGLDYKVTSAKVLMPVKGCHQKDLKEAFPIMCHVGGGTLTVSGEEGKKSTELPLYFAMLRLSPSTLDDMYDQLDVKTVFARLTFATRLGHDVELSEMFGVQECATR